MKFHLKKKTALSLSIALVNSKIDDSTAEDSTLQLAIRVNSY